MAGQPTPRGRRGRGDRVSGPFASAPKTVHLLVAFLLGAMLARQVMVREVHTIDEVRECGDVKQDQYGGKEVVLGLSDTDGLKTGSLKRIVDRAENGTVILTFANSKYKDSMVNWIANVERLHIRNYAVVCLDSELPKWLALHKGSCAYHLTGWKSGAWSVGGPNTCANEGQMHTPDDSLPMCKLACEQDVSCKAITWEKSHRKCYICSTGYQVRPSPLEAHEIHLKVCFFFAVFRK